MTTQDTVGLWNDVLASIKVTVSSAIFNTWFAQTHLTKLDDTGKRAVVEIGCSSSFIKNTVETRYYGLIQASLSQALGRQCDLVFVVKDLPKPKAENNNAPLFENKDAKQQVSEEALRRANIRPGFTFDNFAVSGSNQMAWAASEAVSKSPGTAYNPLFIWGGVGLGKTHLMFAIGRSLLEENPDTKVLIVTGEEFTNDIVTGIRNKTTAEVRNKYRKLHALMVDDIQFIAGKDTIGEEFFHTFNAVTAAGGQVVLTSDKPPNEIPKLEERLRSRFEAGLIVDIAPSDFELRCAICEIKAKERGLELAPELVHIIAGNIESARQIQGFLIRLVSESKLKSEAITEEMITGLLGKKDENGASRISARPDEVINTVSKYFTISKKSLLSKVRTRSIARPRQILMYMLRTELRLPLQEVGRLLDRDHTTVMHAVDIITKLASNDVQIREHISGIKSKL